MTAKIKNEWDLFDTLVGFASRTTELIRTVGPLIEKVKEHWQAHWPNIHG